MTTQMLTLFYLYFILTQLTTLFFRDTSFPGVCNIFLLVLFLTVVTVPGTWFGHSKHLLNAESKYHFPLSNQYSIVFFKDFYFKVFINTFYMFIYCTFHHLLVTFLMFTFSFKCQQRGSLQEAPVWAGGAGSGVFTLSGSHLHPGGEIHLPGKAGPPVPPLRVSDRMRVAFFF